MNEPPITWDLGPPARLDTTLNAFTLELLQLTDVVHRYTLAVAEPAADRARAVALITELRALAARVDDSGREMIAALVSRPH